MLRAGVDLIGLVEGAPPSPSSPASTCSVTGLSRLKNCRTGASAISFFTFLNASSCVCNHTNFISFLVNSVSGRIVGLRFSQYGARKLIMPMKWRRLALSCGASIFVIAATLSGSAFIPWDVMMCPTNLTVFCLNCSFFGLKRRFLARARSSNAILFLSWSLSASSYESPKY